MFHVKSCNQRFSIKIKRVIIIIIIIIIIYLQMDRDTFCQVVVPCYLTELNLKTDCFRLCFSVAFVTFLCTSVCMENQKMTGTHFIELHTNVLLTDFHLTVYSISLHVLSIRPKYMYSSNAIRLR